MLSQSWLPRAVLYKLLPSLPHKFTRLPHFSTCNIEKLRDSGDEANKLGRGLFHFAIYTLYIHVNYVLSTWVLNSCNII